MIFLSIAVVIGIVIFGVGVTVFFSPTALRGLLGRLIDFKWIWPATVIRLLVVWILFNAAPVSKLPVIIYIFSMLILITAGVIPVLGKKYSDDLVKFWNEAEISMIRFFGAFSTTLGLLIIYACWV